MWSLWLVHVSTQINLPQEGRTPCFYSNQSKQDLRLTILSSIEQAKHSIYLATFGLTDPATLQLLEKKNHSGIQIKAYYDPTGGANIPSFSWLSPIRKNGLMHQKLLIVDRKLILLGSANMTLASLRMHDNLLVGFQSESVAQFLLSHPPFSSGYRRTSIQGQDLELWLLPDIKNQALFDLKRHLKNASRSIRIALFTLTHPSLIDELISAKKRGVLVSVIIDAHTGLGASSKAIKLLKEEKINVSLSLGLQLLHHKFAWIDETTLIMGSANWTKAAFIKNSDILLALHDLTSEQKDFIKNLWDQLDASSKRAP